MSSVGLVLGGGGITGASYHFGVLLAIKMATGWDPNSADVIVGTSCGSFVAALIRGDALDLDILVGESANREEVAERLRSHVFRRRRTPRGGIRWLRNGLLPGLFKPDLNLIVGSPGMYDTSGIAAWVEESIGDLANTWPEKPTVVVGYDVAEKLRVPFGTEGAPPFPSRMPSPRQPQCPSCTSRSRSAGGGTQTAASPAARRQICSWRIPPLSTS